MSRKANESVNQFLFFLIKELVRYHQKGSLHEDLTKEDYLEISEKTNSQLTVSTLIKMYTDPSRYKWGNNILNYFSTALPNDCIYYKNYKLFVEKESNHHLFEVVDNKTYYDIDKPTLREIKKSVVRRVLEILSNIHEPSANNIPTENFDKDILASISVATDKDVYQIYLFALNRYGDCDLNPPDIKLAWKATNEKVFYVIHDSYGDVKANINLLPISKDSYNKIKSGKIEEREISPQEIMPLSKKGEVEFIYVEGLNCLTKEHLLIFGENFHRMICTLAEPKKDLKIGAIGGTLEGEKLMYRLGFKVVGKYKKDNYDFFEVPYTRLFWEIDKIKKQNF